MDRRTFLSLGSGLSITALLPVSLTSCGVEEQSVESSSTSLIDEKLISVKQQQFDVSSINDELNRSFNNTLAIPSTSSPSTLLQASAQIDTASANFFSTRKPEYLLPHYLESTGTGNIWENAIAAHQLAFEQYNHQSTKLVAAFRLYDAKNKSSDAFKSASISKLAAAKTSARALLTPSAEELLNQLNNLVEAIVNGDFSADLINIIAAALQALYVLLQDVFSTDQLRGLAYAFLVYLSIDKLLDAISQQTITNLAFDDKESILLSLSKVSIASVALLSLTKINELKDTSSTTLDSSTSDITFISTFLTSNDIISKISLSWLSLIESLTSETIEGTMASAQSAILATDETVPADANDLIATLRANAVMLAIISLTMNSIFNLLKDQGIDASSTEFSEGSTADIFKILFGSEQNLYDEALSEFTTNNVDAFLTQLSTSSINITELGEQHVTITVSSTEEATTTTHSIESDAYAFALQLATFAFEFTSQTEADAAAFASEMANLAYQFTIDIEEDAYQFALQGMEYGYLFASRGEEVGIMADRILWMAVQIGVMADRIGEMADRIVYTEQLIVYTEMLILDFGILIYGVIKQITNLILTGMALILDREWYSPESEDIILETISSNVNLMLQNMHQYSLTVLEHQNELRQLTLDALDTVNFAETTGTNV